jgi:alanine dehydrogenase
VTELIVLSRNDLQRLMQLGDYVEVVVNPERSEIEPALMARATIVADIAAQSAVMGDLNHATGSGSMSADAVHVELGEVITAKKTGRTSPTEIMIFDGTGTGIQDVPAAARAYELAGDAGVGARIQLS